MNADIIPANSDFDEIDRQIVAALRKDGREAFTQIAKRLNVSAGMIRMRYNRLVELGVLRVIAVSNPLSMGYNTMALIGIKTEGDKLLEVAYQVTKLDEVVYLIVVSGSYDIIVEVMCRDQDHLLQFLTNRLYKIEGIRESESFIHLKILKEIYF
jgi:Lrp/AsnC family transcriptional regulator for asnA, asnC and gidA